MGTSRLAGTCLFVSIVAAGCATAPVEARSDFDSSADFTSYRSFGWISEHPLAFVDPSTSPQFEGRAMTAISEVLQDKGYRFEADGRQADFVVSFSLGARDEVRVNSYPAQYDNVWESEGQVQQAADVRTYTEGTLAIDLFDVERRQPVWHGWVVKTISANDRANASAVTRELVEAILAKFPP
jgi:hypothetical protein